MLQTSIYFLFIFSLFLSFYNPQPSSAKTVPLREEISLNGQWSFQPIGDNKTKIKVPEYWDALPQFKKVKQAIYRKTVIVPENWKNKIIKLEFDGVNHIAEVYANGNFIGKHVGGWIPFTFDISNFAKPGEKLQLKVIVKGGTFPPISDSNGNPAYPVGWYGNVSRWGIIFDTWLRAYGKVNISDAYIQTSYRNKSIEIQYTINNNDDKPHQVTIQTNISPSDSNLIVKSLSSANIKLSPRQTKIVTLSSDWQNPKLWMPDEPNLYILKSKIIESDNLIDEEARRFGFREVWISGNKYFLNGIKVNLLGTSLNWHGESYDKERYEYMSDDTWPNTIDKLKNLNVRIVRLHQQPAPISLLNLADEKGLMLIEESAIYARDYLKKSNKNLYLKNSKSWLADWVKSRRNHPSIILWSVTNEMGFGNKYLGWLTNSEIKSLGNIVRSYDQTRPLIYDGEREVDDQTLNYHYIEGYEKLPKGSIYQWSSLVSANKPTGVGEFLYFTKPSTEAWWWQGQMSRGLRYSGFADIRPYILQDYALRDIDTPVAANIRNSFNPIALFDKDYDDLGIEPVKNKNYPSLNECEQIVRDFVLYNDDYRDEKVTIKVSLQANDEVYASTEKTYTIPLGEHVEVNSLINLPELDTNNIALVLQTYKNGIQRFEEYKYFNINKLPGQCKSSAKIVLGNP